MSSEVIVPRFSSQGTILRNTTLFLNGGGAVTLQQGTRVEILWTIEATGPLRLEVRVLDGKQRGRTGQVFASDVQ